MRRVNRVCKAVSRIGPAAFSAIEVLEQRRLLSSSVTSMLVPDSVGTGQTLEIAGTKNKDYINVFDDPDDGMIAVVNDKNHNGVNDWNEETDFNYDSSDYIDVVHIDAKQGDDTVTYNLVDDYEGDHRSIEVDLSDGNDKFTFSSATDQTQMMPTSCQASPDGADILDHSNINMEIEGQEKNDTIDIDLSNTFVSESELLVNVDAGSGNDKVSFEAPNADNEKGIGGEDRPAALPIDGESASDYTQVQIQVDLGTGNNLYSQDINTEIFGGQLTVNVNGNSGKDTVQADDDYSLEEDSAYFFTANLQGGNDYYNGELGFNQVGEGSEANYNLQGGDGNDRMTLEGFTNEFRHLQEPVSGIKPASVSPEDSRFEVDGIFTVNMYGGTGNDTVDMWADENNDIITIPVDPNVKAKPAGAASGTRGGDTFPMFIDTEEDGSVRVVLSGDAGNDKVGLFLGATEGSEGDYDLSVLGAAGKDTVAAGFLDDTLMPSNVTFGPSGAVLLDGGRDTDTYQAVAYGDVSNDPSGFFTPFDIRAVEVASLSLLPPLI